MPADRVGGRRAVLVGFAAFGAFWGSWGAVVPAVQRRAGVDDAELGVALLLIGAGALASMRVAGSLVDRFGARVLPLAVGALAAAASLPALAGSAVALSAALLVVGAASGATDVALNTAGAAWEARGGAPLLNLAHAAFSLAVVGASLTAGLLRHAGVGPVGILGLDAVALAGCAVAVRPRVRSALRRPPGRGTLAGRPPGAPAAAGRRVTRRLLVLGLLCALAYWVESAWQNWGAVLLENALGAAAGTSALAPALFALAAATGRLCGQRLARRLADRAVLRAGALTATAGTALAAAAPAVPVALVGIVVAGAGTAVCAPTILSLGGRGVPGDERGAAIGTITTIAYLGFLLGPAAVGLLAGATTLRGGLGAVAGVALVLAAAAGSARPPARPR